MAEISSLIRKTVRVSSSTGDGIPAYLVRPAGRVSAALVLLHSMYGVNELFRNFCDRYAECGYVVIAPELFWRIADKGVPDSAEERYEQGHGYISRYDYDLGMTDIADAVAFVRSKEPTVTKVGVVGYCLGGSIAFIAAARTGIDAAVCYYPIYVERHLHCLETLRAPTVIHLGTKDKYAPPEIFAILERQCAAHPQVEFYAYPGAIHGFANAMDPRRYDEASTRLADRRTHAALRRHLATA